MASSCVVGNRPVMVFERWLAPRLDIKQGPSDDTGVMLHKYLSYGGEAWVST